MTARTTSGAARTHAWFTPWVLVAPALVFLVAFNLWPAANVVFLAFTNVRVLSGGELVGLANFERMLTDDQLVTALVNSIVYMLVCVPFLLLVPLGLAVLVEKKLPGIAFFRTAFYTPVVASAVVVALIWGWLLDDRGVVNAMALRLGFVTEAVPFLTDRWLVLLSAISLTVWKGLGYYMVIYLSALGGVPRELHEAAAVDGASALRRFWSVTVPGVRNTMLLVSVMIIVSALRVFAELYILTDGTGGVGGADVSVVMLIQMYARGFSGNLGYASALSLLLFVVTLAPLLLIARMNRGRG
ncbi:carbohydrate ABC transporter permease [Promicromonospora citrea]|uniref:ABC transporter permease n=1 Tax=Promicromonospora citrea TaxID=43677 RepID=A0A8H9GP99_9MICO|nr:sugar ABC transporter permease [Promicromonospora citrea]NNH53720.1 sugar ABC transporter permease [Promicromonospora citrea]GGM39518.1 ABC transporter permease [Promicromonospora citrea]